MTEADALVRLILARYDGKKLTKKKIAEILEAIPPYCRFIWLTNNATSEELAVIVMIRALFSDLEQKRKGV